jgi:hypothetical protein
MIGRNRGLIFSPGPSYIMSRESKIQRRGTREKERIIRRYTIHIKHDRIDTEIHKIIIWTPITTFRTFVVAALTNTIDTSEG